MGSELADKALTPQQLKTRIRIEITQAVEVLFASQAIHAMVR